MASHEAPCLVVTDTLGRRTIALDKPVVSLGRRSESDVHVNSPGVSRLHAEIVQEQGTWQLRDLESRFGTFVNGERVTAMRPLVHGDRVRLGESEDVAIVFVESEEGVSQVQSAASAATGLRQLAALLHGLRATGSGGVLDDVLTLVLDAAIEATGAERGFIMLADSNKQLEFTTARARGHISLSGRFFETSRQIPEQVFATRRSAIVEDLQGGGMLGNHAGTIALGIRYVLCAPLRLVRYVDVVDTSKPAAAALEEVIGVLYLDSRERGAIGSESAKLALETLSAEAAMAINNARLYRESIDKAKLEQELRVAAGIQQALLPPADYAGRFFSCSAASVACRAVGGDFFDYVDLPTDAFGFILGDVAGKGSPAALLASALVGMFTTEASHHAGAATLVERLNHGLFRRRIEARFATAFYGVLAPDGRLTYTSAGHNPPMLFTGGAIRRLDIGGMVLGLFDGAPFAEGTVALAPGDTLVVFSDGVSEAMNSNFEEFGDERIAACIEAHRDDPPPALVAALQAEVRQFFGEALPNDDVTLLVIRYTGQV